MIWEWEETKPRKNDFLIGFQSAEIRKWWAQFLPCKQINKRKTKITKTRLFVAATAYASIVCLFSISLSMYLSLYAHLSFEIYDDAVLICVVFESMCVCVCEWANSKPNPTSAAKNSNHLIREHHICNN